MGENINKVTFNGVDLIDLTQDTVDENSLLSGYSAHTAAGEHIFGTLSKAISYYDESTDTIDVPNETFLTIGSFTCPSKGYAIVSCGARFGDMGASAVVRRIVNVYLDEEEKMLWETTCALGGELWSGGSVILSCKENSMIEGKIYHTGGAQKPQTYVNLELCLSPIKRRRE